MDSVEFDSVELSMRDNSSELDCQLESTVRNFDWVVEASAWDVKHSRFVIGMCPDQHFLPETLRLMGMSHLKVDPGGVSSSHPTNCSTI